MKKEYPNFSQAIAYSMLLILLGGFPRKGASKDQLANEIMARIQIEGAKRGVKILDPEIPDSMQQILTWTLFLRGMDMVKIGELMLGYNKASQGADVDLTRSSGKEGEESIVNNFVDVVNEILDLDVGGAINEGVDLVEDFFKSLFG